MPRHDHYARGTFGSSFGGSVGCIFGIVFAIGVLILGGFLMCAGIIGGCGVATVEVAKQAEEARQAKERIEKKRAETEPRAKAPDEYSIANWARARVTSATYGPVQVNDLGQIKISEKKYLTLTLELTVTDPKKIWNFSGWEEDGEFLTDADGNKYRQPGFGFGSSIVGAGKTGRVTSEEPIATNLVFEAPPPGITEVRLDLPAGPVKPGVFFRFSIPSAMWRTPTGE